MVAGFEEPLVIHVSKGLGPRESINLMSTHQPWSPKSSSRSSYFLEAREPAPRALLTGLEVGSSLSLSSVTGKDLDVRVGRARDAEGRRGDAAFLAFRLEGMMNLEDEDRSRLGKSRFGVTAQASNPLK